jgi:dipeptidyl aminopeptidase/acylaminoacyl peptidase
MDLKQLNTTDYLLTRNERKQMRNLLKSGLVSMIFASIILSAVPAISQDDAKPQEKPIASVKTEKAEAAKIHIDQWLRLGPIKSQFPAFNDEENKDNDAAFLLSFKDIDISRLSPSLETPVNTFEGSASWTIVSADTLGALIEGLADMPSTSYLAAYIELPRWMKIEVEAASTDLFELFIDGVSLVKSEKANGTGNLGDVKSGSRNLKQGKHLLIVKMVQVPGDTIADWRMDASLKATEDFKEKPVISIDPTTRLDISHILDVPNISGIDVSPNGDLVLISYWRFLPPDGERETYREIRSLPGGELVSTIRESDMSNIEWAPSGNRLSYVSQRKGKGSIRILDLDTGGTEVIIEDIKDLRGYTWSPDGTWMAYYINVKDKDDGTGVKRLRGIQDRQRFARGRTSMMMTSVPGGSSRKLAAGKFDSYVSDIHPDGRKILLSRYYEDLSERPFGTSELILLDLDDMSTRQLHKGHWVGGAQWSPDGKKILIEAGPSTFGDIGKDVEEGVIPNDYDGQLYIMDPGTGKVEALSKDFDPAITGAIWSKTDNRIYITAQKKDLKKFYRYDSRKKTFREIKTEADIVSRLSISSKKSIAAFAGEGASMAPAVYSIDLKKDRVREIASPGSGILNNVKIGEIGDFDFITESGTTIIGRIHYPPDFDSTRLYPCIVYYYAGTSPVGRRFGGRYPFNLWAAKDFIVYVLQPSGATGFGQKFSTAHVNDWGKVTSEEIISGVGKFLDAHPFVNRYRVGCEGASYGGFMTQLLITRTDIFAAAVSHAGISMIGSYWGEGYWGYGYNAVSAAESYPWNRPDIYVDQSPLFAADKIVTPLLLLHGAADTNVPPGESEQMYTALKILGKDVEYIKYEGQNHFILDYKKRKSWSDAQLAWFDKYLKDQPEWWDEMYPPIDPPKKSLPAYHGMHEVILKDDYKALLGEVTKEDIANTIPEWDSEFFEYTPDTEALAAIEEEIYGVEITCVLGTWCSDSQREIPRLWKILETVNYPVSEIKMYAVGSSRFSAGTKVPARVLSWSKRLKDYFDVERVATIIISRGGKEIGRIVETPEESLEKDLIKILNKE